LQLPLAFEPHQHEPIWWVREACRFEERREPGSRLRSVLSDAVHDGCAAQEPKPDFIERRTERDHQHNRSENDDDPEQ
jgi:hypothetical protein